MAAAGRIEFFKDAQGYSTGLAQNVKEFTGTYEYKLKFGLLTRVEYRHDWSDKPSFHKGSDGMTDNQNTVSAGMILIIAPKR